MCLKGAVEPIFKPRSPNPSVQTFSYFTMLSLYIDTKHSCAKHWSMSTCDDKLKGSVLC